MLRTFFVGIFFLTIVYTNEGLLQGDDNPSTRELLSIINQLNQTLQSQSKKLAEQEIILAKLKASHQSTHTAFYAEMNADITLGEHQIVEFDNVITNEGNAFDARHGHFIAPVNGIYIFSVNVMKPGNGGALHVDIVKNGIEVSRAYSDDGSYDTGSTTAFLRLNIGDMVWVRHNSLNGIETIHGDHYSNFGGTLVFKL